MNKKDELLKIFSLKLRTMLSKVEFDYDKLHKNAYIILKNEIRETMEYISNFSLYAFEEEIKQGFITITGGHRVGIVGKAVLDDNKIKSIKHISFINIRLSHQIKGCGDKVLSYLLDEYDNCYHTLIISPPRCGKTTLLRDVIRQLSNGNGRRPGMTVGVVDERSEIGACYMGIPQNDLGIRTDVLDCCPKAKGMLMLIRSMSPSVIAVDEVGSGEDIDAIEYVMNCGCKLIATVHGNSIEDIKSKPILGKLVEERLFERYILLSNAKGVGHLEAIYDAHGNKISI